jgi:hypothetical protein
MSKPVKLLKEHPLLDIASYARGGIRHLSRAELQLIERTVHRLPEVMVKVTGGAHKVAGVQRHLQYIDREGTLQVETDVGAFHRPGYEKTLLKDWDLDLEERPKAREFAGPGRKPKKLVHNLIFSMPPGTDPQKVLHAVRQLAKEEWMLKHRFAMVLHTDEPHPHVHVVIKARSEKGKRLNIRKSTLRGWRQQFAYNLRKLGVAANATERAVRGAKKTLPDGLYRAVERGEFIHLQPNATSRHPMQRNASMQCNPKELLQDTRQQILEGWRYVYSGLKNQREENLALSVRMFIDHFKRQIDPEASRAPERGRTGPERER